MKENTKSGLKPGTRLVVKVLQDVLRTESFDTYADLKEELKVRCARLKIHYDATLITEAIDQVEQGGRQCCLTVKPAPVVPPQEPDGRGPVISREDATRIYNNLLRRYKEGHS